MLTGEIENSAFEEEDNRREREGCHIDVLGVDDLVIPVGADQPRASRRFHCESPHLKGFAADAIVTVLCRGNGVDEPI